MTTDTSITPSFTREVFAAAAQSHIGAIASYRAASDSFVATVKAFHANKAHDALMGGLADTIKAQEESKREAATLSFRATFGKVGLTFQGSDRKAKDGNTLLATVDGFSLFQKAPKAPKAPAVQPSGSAPAPTSDATAAQSEAASTVAAKLKVVRREDVVASFGDFLCGMGETDRQGFLTALSKYTASKSVSIAFGVTAHAKDEEVIASLRADLTTANARHVEERTKLQAEVASLQASIEAFKAELAKGALSNQVGPARSKGRKLAKAA